jgi:hypothetical protein
MSPLKNTAGIFILPGNRRVRQGIINKARDL